MQHKSLDVNDIVGGILRIGSTISIVLMVLGLALYLPKGSLTAQTHVVGLHQALSGALRLDPISIMTLGIVVLLVIPILRVLGAFLSFLIIEKDLRYSLISLGVFVILLFSLFGGIK